MPMPFLTKQWRLIGNIQFDIVSKGWFRIKDYSEMLLFRYFPNRVIAKKDGRGSVGSLVILSGTRSFGKGHFIF